MDEQMLNRYILRAGYVYCIESGNLKNVAHCVYPLQEVSRFGFPLHSNMNRLPANARESSM